jgi:hypothetical protein
MVDKSEEYKYLCGLIETSKIKLTSNPFLAVSLNKLIDDHSHTSLEKLT